VRAAKGATCLSLPPRPRRHLVEPFSTSELLARANSLLRRAKPALVAEVITVGDIELDRCAMIVIAAASHDSQYFRRCGAKAFRWSVSHGCNVPPLPSVS
jgi:hypothetical protein